MKWFHGPAMAIAALLTCCSSAAWADDWASWGNDGARARATEERAGANFSALWRLRLPAERELLSRAIVASPAAADGFVAFATLDRSLRVVRSRNAQEVWNFESSGGFVASPAVSRGIVFASALDGVLRAFALASGALLWSQPLGVTHASPTLVSLPEGDALLVATGFPHRTLYRLDARTGQVRWKTAEGDLRRSSHASVAVAHDTVVAGVVGGVIQAFDLHTGKMLWAFEAGGELYTASPVIVGTTVWAVVADEGVAKVHAIDLKTGAAVEGWPLALPATAADVEGASRMSVQLALGAPAVHASTLYLQLRFTDHWDTNNDRVADRYILRERLMAIAMASQQVLWSLPLGERTTNHAADIPTLTFCPSPAVFRGADGHPLVAAASSLEPHLRVIDPASGKILESLASTAPARSSPLLANGTLLVGTDAATLEAFASLGNTAPEAPSLGPLEVPLHAPLLRWPRVFDRELQPVSYLVRLDDDGELLRDWKLESLVSDGATELQLPSHLVKPGARYHVAVRARDSFGAWSSWSATINVDVVQMPTVAVGDRPFGTLREALAAARPGDRIRLGAGRHELHGHTIIPAGVTLEGAGPGATYVAMAGGVLSVEGAGAGGADSPATRISQLTFAGAQIAIDVRPAARVTIENVIVLRSSQAAIAVRPGAHARIKNVTLATNAVALDVEGAATITNSLVLANEMGVRRQGAGDVDARYNDLFDNDVNREGVLAHETEFSTPVLFVDRHGEDLRVQDGQPSTDQGDPADGYALEPAPNGSRINLGAFGNTPEAERSRSQSDHSPDAARDADSPPDGGTAPDGGMAPDAGPQAQDEFPSRAEPDHQPAPTVPPARSPAHGCEVAPRSSGNAAWASLPALWLASVLRRRKRNL